MLLWCSEAQCLVGTGSEAPAHVFDGLACFQGSSQGIFVQLGGRPGWAAGSSPGCRSAGAGGGIGVQRSSPGNRVILQTSPLHFATIRNWTSATVAALLLGPAWGGLHRSDSFCFPFWKLALGLGCSYRSGRGCTWCSAGGQPWPWGWCLGWLLCIGPTVLLLWGCSGLNCGGTERRRDGERHEAYLFERCLSFDENWNWTFVCT